MNFMVCSRGEIERGVLVRTAYVVVSITDPDKHLARIREPAGFRGALRVQFHDAEPANGEPLASGIVLISQEQAEQIWKFVAQLEPEVGTILVHCEQGMSRSPAVAAALAEWFGEDHYRFFRQFQPNKYVYELMCAARPPLEHG